MMRKIITLTVLALLVSVAWAKKVPKNQPLQKTMMVDPLLNRARAYLDKGKLKIAVENYGIFSGTASPQGLWGDFQYISNLSLVVGIPGKDKNGNPYPWAMGPKQEFNIKTQDFYTVGTDTTYWGPTVSESWFDRTPNLNRTDWEAVEDARIRLHNPLATAGEYYGKLGLYTYPEDQTPLIATSDIPETWPGTDQERHWPGPWAVDPADPTKEMPGTFVSDQDIYFEFDDRLATRDVDPNQGYPIGIRAKVSGYSYGASISEDIIFFKMTLVNESPYDYEGMYAGFYFDVDAYNRLANGAYWGRTNDDDMMGYNLDYNFGYIYDLDGDHNNPYVGNKKLAYSAVKLLDTPVATDSVDLDGDGVPDILPGDKLGLTSWHWFDWYFRPGARDVNPQQGPWSGDGQTRVAKNKEEIQYKILAGDTTNLTAYDSTYYFHPLKNEAGNVIKLNPRFDSLEGLLHDYPDGLDCVFIMASGPFSLASGDSVPFSFCVIMGEDEKDLEANARIAQLMYDNHYQGARPPKAPKVIAREDDQKVTLYWDASSVHDTDVLTGYQDFEGFRIYRSEDNGKTWGEKMYDEESKTTYWKPYAQFDIEDGITGYDKTAPHRYLGDDTGLVFSFVDSGDVRNGTEYLYAVCAYDRGFVPNDPVLDPDSAGAKLGLKFSIPSLENFLSNSTNLSHIVKAIPHRPPSNATLAQLKVEKLPGTIGTGIFKVEVINPKDVTGDTYKILFDCDYSDPPTNQIIVPGSQRYDIIDITNGDTLVKNSTEWAKDTAPPEAPPIFDGLRWGIQMSTDITLQPKDAYWTPNSKCTYKFENAALIPHPGKSRADYLIAFIGEGADTVYRDLRLTKVHFTVPFQVWNTVTHRKAKLLCVNKKDFEPGAKFFVFENHLYETPDDPTYRQTFYFVFNWVPPNTYDDKGNLIPPDVPWAVGDTLIVPVRKPFERGDGFLVNTSQVFTIHTPKKNDLNRIKVVPNPYFVHAQWETDDFVRKIQFTNLPSKCKIHIFTVSGEEVITLHHDNAFDGSEDWDMLTKNRQEIAPGLYVYVVEDAKGNTHAGKFVVIK